MHQLNIDNPLLLAPEILEILKNKKINSVIKGYLGDDAVFCYSFLWRIPACADIDWSSSLWHHDHCGRVLKLFVYLHDVEPGTRTTKYAIGSNNMRHFGRWESESRYGHDEIEGRFKISEFSGKAGDCVLFDTNGLHKATWTGNGFRRDMLVFGFMSYAKSQAMSEFGYLSLHRETFPFGFESDGTMLRSDLLTDELLVYDVNGSKMTLPVTFHGRLPKPDQANPIIDAISGRVTKGWSEAMRQLRRAAID